MNKIKKRTTRLGRDVSIAAGLFIVCICICMGCIGYVPYYRNMHTQYNTYIGGILNYVEGEIDGDKLETYLDAGGDLLEYPATKEIFADIKKTQDIFEITLEELDPDEPDTDGIDYYYDKYDGNYVYSGAVSIRNSDHKELCYLVVEIEVSGMQTSIVKYGRAIAIGAVINALIFFVNFYIWIRKRVLKPIKKLNSSAQAFVQSGRETKNPDELVLINPEIHSHDEVRQLSDSFTEKMILRKTFFKNGKSTDQNEIFHRRELLPASIRRQINKKALIVFDLHFKNCILGYLVLQIAEGEWPTDFGQAYMMALANAIENGSAQKEIEDLEQYRKLYRRDELTGLYNRRGYESSLRSLYSRSKKEKCQLTVVSIDMDGLKYINDHYGHAEGDEALFRLAVVLAELMEENEICARVGGDEFVVLLYYNEEGREERFVKDLEELLLEEQQRNPKPYPVHASVGYCCVSKNANLSLAACVQLADTRMYENKKAYKESLESSESSRE